MTALSAREAVGLFRDHAMLRAAADDLLVSGFDRADLSVLAGREKVVSGLGHDYGSVAELEDDPDVRRMAYFGSDSLTELRAVIIGVLFFIGAVVAAGTVVANQGSTESAILSALVAGGLAALLGVFISLQITRRHGHYLRDHLAYGGMLLWVRARDKEHETAACRILKEYAAEDVHIHDMADAGSTKRFRLYGYLDWLAGDKPPVR